MFRLLVSKRTSCAAASGCSERVQGEGAGEDQGVRRGESGFDPPLSEGEGEGWRMKSRWTAAVAA